MPRDVDKTTPFEKSGRAKPATAKPAPAKVTAHMFGNFEAAKKRKMPRWAVPLLTAMLAFHVVLFVTMWVKTIWDVEALERPKGVVDIAVASAPPPPPPPPKGAVKPKDVVITPKKVKVRDIVQPVKIEKQEVAPPVETGDPNGVEGGVEGGVAGGDLSGVVAAPPPPPPPPPPPGLQAPPDVAAAPADAKKTPSGLASKVITPGKGSDHPGARDRVTVHYTGWTPDGKMFDSSVQRGQPARFPLNGVIKGWTESVQLMVVGDKARFWIPGSLAYGDKPSQPGAPAGPLVFDIELLGIR